MVNVLTKLTVSPKYVTGLWLFSWTVVYLEEVFQALNMLGSHVKIPWSILNALQIDGRGGYGVLLSSF